FWTLPSAVAGAMCFSCCSASAGKSGSKPCSRIVRTAAASRSNAEERRVTLRAAGKLAGFGVDLHLVALFDEERHADFESGLERRRFRGAAAGGVAAKPGLCRRHDELDVRWKLETNRLPVVLLQLDDEVVDEQLAAVADLFRAERHRLEAV